MILPLSCVEASGFAGEGGNDVSGWNVRTYVSEGAGSANSCTGKDLRLTRGVWPSEAPGRIGWFDAAGGWGGRRQKKQIFLIPDVTQSEFACIQTHLRRHGVRSQGRRCPKRPRRPRRGLSAPESPPHLVRRLTRIPVLPADAFAGRVACGMLPDRASGSALAGRRDNARSCDIAGIAARGRSGQVQRAGVPDAGLSCHCS